MYTSGAASASQLAALSASSDIPTTSELASLAQALRERKKLNARRLENVHTDENDVLAGRLSRSDVRSMSLADVLDGAEGSGRRSRSRSASRPERSAPLGTQSSSSSKQGKSRPGLAISPPPVVASPAPGTPVDSSRPKIKVKRDPDHERERSAGATSVTSASGSHVPLSGTARAGLAASPGLEADWDDEGPARPGRTYFNKRKRNRTSATDRDSGDEISQSEMDSPHPGSGPRHQGDSSWSRPESMFSGAHGSSSTFKLKLNPTAQTAAHKRDSFSSGLLRRPSGLRGEDFGQMPLTPFQIQQAAMWELPKRTADTFIPKKPQPRQIRPYPTRPNEVDVDFASMDWRERDRERDRQEAAAAAAGSSAAGSGPGPGQAVVKESAVSRARDRKQDQVPFHTFQQWCDGWFRTLTEEDLAWLSSKPEDLEPFNNPALGRYYREVWEEEEANGAPIPTVYLPNAPYSTTPLTANLSNGNALTGRPGNLPANGVTKAAVPAHMAKPPKFDPRQLKDDHLFAGSLDEVRSGPLTERMLSALLPTPPPSEPASEGGTQTNGGGGGTGGLVLISGHGGGSAGVSQDMADYEDRLMRELKAIDVPGADDAMDWSERTDDEISSTLRKVQRLLRKQIRINEMRKSRLFDIAMDRMAYQDYVACLTSVEREIESGWLKRQTQIRKSMQAQKKKKGSSNSSSSNSNNVQASAGSAPASASGAAAVAAKAVGDAGATANSPFATGTPGGGGGAAMVASASGQGFVPENRGGGPIKPQFSESLIGAMEKRRQLQFAFEPMFAEKPLARLTPRGDDSVFKDLDLS